MYSCGSTDARLLKYGLSAAESSVVTWKHLKIFIFIYLFIFCFVLFIAGRGGLQARSCDRAVEHIGAAFPELSFTVR